MAKRLLGGIALCVCLAMPVWADAPTTTVIGTPPQPTWNQLTPQERTTLAPLGSEWDKMENYRRKKWLGIAERFSRMTPEEQRRIQERMREWALMTPEQRSKVRDIYKEFKQLPPEKKQAVKEKWETYSKLPEEEKAKLKQAKTAAKPADQPPAGAAQESAQVSPTTAISPTAVAPKP